MNNPNSTKNMVKQVSTEFFDKLDQAPEEDYPFEGSLAVVMRCFHKDAEQVKRLLVEAGVKVVKVREEPRQRLWILTTGEIAKLRQEAKP